MEHAQGGAPAGNVKRGGLSATALKVIAILAMVVDHATRVFVADYYSPLGAVLHAVGRITGPIMFYFIAEGYHRTRSPNRYTLRLGVFAAVSYVPFIYFRTGGLPSAASWMDLNVIYTLFIGLLALRAMHEIADRNARIIMVVLCFVACLPGDWSYMALLYILAFDMFRGDFAKQAFAYTCISLTRVIPPAAQLFTGWLRGAGWGALGAYFWQMVVYAGLFLPLGLLRFYNGERGRGDAGVNKWLFYVFYPAHLLVLGLVAKMAALGL